MKNTTTAKTQSDLRIYYCGGTAINIGRLFVATCNTLNGQNANMVGLDMSDRNNPQNGEFEVERQPGAHGSGKDGKTNYEGAPAFVDDVLARHKPGVFNIVVLGTGGGSGWLLGALIIRKLLEAQLPVVAMIIGDTSSEIELANTIRTFSSLDAHRKALNLPVVFNYLENGNETYQSINEKAVNRMEFLSLMLTEEHEGPDREDIRSFLQFSKNTSAPAILTQISICDQNTIGDHKSNVVATMSLYRNAKDVKNEFDGVVYKSVGIFREGIKLPSDLQVLHAVLDHGDTVQKITALIESQKDRNSMTKMRYVAPTSLGNDADENGISFNLLCLITSCRNICSYS